MIRWSADGQSFGSEALFVQSAGVVSVTSSSAGILAAAFQWFPLQQPDAFDKVAVRFSETGGKSWTDSVPIEVTGPPAGYQRPFDPTIVALPQGGYRLYFSCGTKTPGPLTAQSDISTYSAISADGIHYTFEPGPRFRVEGRRVIDCSVAFDGKAWNYIAPIGRPDEGAYDGSSNDGLTFTRLKDISSTNAYNWTGNLVQLGERLRFYGSGQQAIWYSERTANSEWSQPSSTNVRGGDPAVGHGANGQLFIIYCSASRRNDPRPQRAPNAAMR
jgi:hypothetical protein